LFQYVALFWYMFCYFKAPNQGSQGPPNGPLTQMRAPGNMPPNQMPQGVKTIFLIKAIFNFKSLQFLCVNN